MRDIISAGIAVSRKIEPSLSASPAGVSWLSAPSLPCAIATTKIETTVRRAPAMARKMRTRHPARIPFGPRNTVLGVCGGSGSAGFDAGMISGFDIARLSGTPLFY